MYVYIYVCLYIYIYICMYASPIWMSPRIAMWSASVFVKGCFAWSLRSLKFQGTTYVKVQMNHKIGERCPSRCSTDLRFVSDSTGSEL